MKKSLSGYKCTHCKKHCLKGYYKCDVSNRIQGFKCTDSVKDCKNFEYGLYDSFIRRISKFI